jgi:radical SAM protein with 4Fe4S-binding SPASM domain
MEAVPLPAFLQIEPVGQCNLRCQMCPILFRKDGPPHGPPAFMPFADFTALLDQFPAVRELQLQGLGEPMMHPRFFEMVRYATERGIQVSTNSNLTLLNARRAAMAVASGLDWLHVSIDGATAATYERIRVRGHFDRLLANLGHLAAAKRQAGSILPHVRLVVVVMRQNLPELADLVRLAHHWSMEAIFVQHLAHDFAESSLPADYLPMREFVQAQTLLEEAPERIAHYFDEARRVAEELGVPLRLPRTRPRLHPPGTPGRTRCDWPWSGAYLSYQGYAMPCCMVATPDRSNFGNMTAHGVREIWDGEAYQKFRQQLASEEPPEICRTCSVYSGTF